MVFIKDSFTQLECASVQASVMRVAKFHCESGESMDFYSMNILKEFFDIYIFSRTAENKANDG